VVGREIFCESGRLGLQHTDFMHPLQPADLARAHVVACDGGARCDIRALLACEVGHGQYRLHALKDYTGPPIPADRVYSRKELGPLEAKVYFAHRH